MKLTLLVLILGLAAAGALWWEGKGNSALAAPLNEERRMGNAVNSMGAGRSAMDEFMRLAAQGKWDAALGCWSAKERARPAKLQELKELVKANPERFRGFQQVIEGRTNFGFEHNAKDEVMELRANGNMQYEGERVMRFRARLVLESNELRLEELAFR
jgi:hypothetical protein